MNNIIVLCGQSGGGKDSLAKLLSDRLGYSFVVSHTSRPMRVGESEGNPYWFVTLEGFYAIMSNDGFIEYRKYNTLVNNIPATWYYGVAKSAIDNSKSYVVVLDVQGMKDFKAHFGDRVRSFYIEVSDETRKERAMSRGSFDDTEWNRRLLDDAIVFKDKSIFDNLKTVDELDTVLIDLKFKILPVIEMFF